MSPFVSWDWQRAWWAAYRRGRTLQLFLARRGGRLVGVLPLYRQELRIGVGLRGERLRFVGTGGDTSPDHLGAVLDPEDEEQIARQMLGAVLAERRWDVLLLSDVRIGSTLATSLVDVARQEGLLVDAGPSMRVGYVPLTDSWEAFVSRLRPKARKRVRRERRHIERELGARFFVWQDPDGLDRAFDRLAALHHLRWQGRGSHSFSSPEYLAFHRDVMHRFLRRGWLRLFGLEVRDEIIAMLYCFRFRDEVFYFQGGFDPAYKSFSPGFVLLGCALQHSIDEGASRFDMLRGEYEHKDLWGGESRLTTHLRIYRRTLAGRACRLRECQLPAMARSLRRVFLRGRSRG